MPELETQTNGHLTPRALSPLPPSLATLPVPINIPKNKSTSHLPMHIGIPSNTDLHRLSFNDLEISDLSALPKSPMLESALDDEYEALSLQPVRSHQPLPRIPNLPPTGRFGMPPRSSSTLSLPATRRVTPLPSTIPSPIVSDAGSPEPFSRSPLQPTFRSLNKASLAISPPADLSVDSPPIFLEENHKKTISDFTILEDCGQGAYGQVKLARHQKSGVKVVLKYVIKKKVLLETWIRDRQLGTVPLEIHVLNYLRKDGLRHDRIVEMSDFFEDSANYYIEMVPHGLPGMDLFDYIELRHDSIQEAECQKIFGQVVDAVHHLHKKALVVHRDIKDENVVLDSVGNIKLIDFGSSAYIKNGPFEVFVGTIDYAAPEVLNGAKYTGKEQDIWAMGVLLWTLIVGENPFYSVEEILGGELRVPDGMSEDSLDLVRRMLDRDVEGRIDIDGVRRHAWCNPLDEHIRAGGEMAG